MGYRLVKPLSYRFLTFTFVGFLFLACFVRGAQATLFMEWHYKTDVESITFIDFTLTNMMDRSVKIDTIAIYLDGVETASIDCGGVGIDSGRSHTFSGTTIHVSSGNHSYYFRVNGAYWRYGWVSKYWEWSSEQVYVPSWWDRYGGAVTLLIVVGAVIGGIIIWRKRKRKPLQPPPTPVIHNVTIVVLHGVSVPLPTLATTPQSMGKDYPVLPTQRLGLG